ncbi:MAG: DUF4345 domain-containing protein [Brachymonas sp.]
MNLRILQIATAVLGLIPILTGLVGLMGVADPLYVREGVPATAKALDSNLRFFSGVWLGLGLWLIWLVPRIATQTLLFRVFWSMIFVGGIGRILSLAMVGTPAMPVGAVVWAVTALEIVGAPLFIWWQSRVAKETAWDEARS